MNSKAMAMILLLVTPVNSFMDFNGSSNYLRLDDGIIPDYPFTITFWYRSTTAAAVATPFMISASGSGTPVIGFFRVGAGDGATNCGTFGRIKYFMRATGDAQFCANKVVTDGNWHFIAGISTSTINHKLRVDDELVTNATPVTFPVVNRTAVGARFQASASLYENADIEDIRIYSRELSTEELDSLYQSRARLHTTDGLIAYWPLDDGVDGLVAGGTTGALDRSGNGKHMTAVSGPVYMAGNNLSQ